MNKKGWRGGGGDQCESYLGMTIVALYLLGLEPYWGTRGPW